MRTRLFLLFLLAPAVAADSLDDALARAGLRRADLGWTPRKWWSRFPKKVRHKLDCFDGLFAEPLATVPFTRALAAVARTHLAPAELRRVSKKSDGALYKLVHGLGVEPKFGAFRSYSANLTEKLTPLDEAIERLYRYAGRKTRFVTFGTESPYPLPARKLKEAASKLPPEVSRILGRLVLEVVEAHRWARLAFRRVSLEDRVRVARRLDLARESVDGLEYEPAVDDVAALWDEASLWYAGLRCVEALDQARHALAKVEALQDASFDRFDWRTPLGWIRVRGTGDHVLHGKDALLIVDLGGDDRYLGAVGTGAPERPLGLCLDLGGKDVYKAEEALAQGAGVCGIGVLLDVAGDDVYEAREMAQGAGQFGLGALIDLEGADRYACRWTGQGAGLFGVGLLADAAGNDRYDLHADGQGFGGVGGVGVLADGGGDDVYRAEPDAAKSERPSYHSDLKISVSNAQGCSMGRRGDGSDGHNWAGGLGALLDLGGSDRYEAGNWSMGTGYWFGAGILYDGGGDDRYDGKVWTQGSGAHFCIGALLDEAGNDRYLNGPGSRAGVAFGHDFTIAMLVDFAGDDQYAIEGDGIGFSINRSVALLIDAGGNDRYHCGKKGNVPGFARYDKRFADHRGASTYFADASSLALFLDLDGKDVYWNGGGDGRSWGDAKGTPNWRVRNVGVGRDLSGGRIDWRARPERGPQREPAGKAAEPKPPK